MDAALLRGWEPGAPRKGNGPQSSAGSTAGSRARAGGSAGNEVAPLLEVSLEDLTRALHEVAPSKSKAGTVGKRRAVRGWWREYRLRAETRRALG